MLTWNDLEGVLTTPIPIVDDDYYTRVDWEEALEVLMERELDSLLRCLREMMR